jgi:lysophospholipid acyltransferase (LPLAT)-like uncharacterized protein
LKLDPESFIARFVVGLGFGLLQIWSRTIRFEVEDRGGVLRMPLSQRLIGAVWHNRLLLLPYVVRRFVPQRQGAALISASRDGGWLAKLVRRFGFDVVRGSSSRRGASAMLQLADVIASGRDVLITPDGPRGPAYLLGDGIIFLAQKSGAPVVPIHMEYSTYWRLDSWDRFFLPRAFSRVRIILGQPHPVLPTASAADFESERARLQSAMMALVEMR